MLKTTLPALFILLALTMNAWADLKLTPAVVQLGDIAGGKPCEVAVTLANDGAEPLEILEVNRDCSCMTPHLDKRLLEPGGRTKLSMAIRTLGHADGAHTWITGIRYRLQEKTLDASLVIHAKITSEVTVKPAVCALFVEKSLRQEIILTDRRPAPLQVTKVTVSHAALRITRREQKAGVVTITLEADAAGLTPGRHDELLSIYTSDPDYGHLEVPITLTRLVSVLAIPNQVELRAEPGHSLPATLIRLRGRGDQAVKVDKVTADNPAITCTWAAGPDKQATLRIQVQPTESLESAVHVRLLEPSGETVDIPVHVRALK
jgi:hypothetical protein